MTLWQGMVVLVLAFCCIPLSLGSCSAFVWQASGRILLAKNLDWPIEDGWVMSNPPGVHKQGFLREGEKALIWQSRYHSVTFNQLAKDFPLGGMNEKGLVIEELNYSPSRYPQTRGACVNEFQWIQYQLDCADSVAAVYASLPRLGVCPVLVGLHYLICDRFGEVAILEFIDGQVRWTSGNELVMPVLTNNSYDNSIDYLRRHEGFGGRMKPHDGPESPERFVRICTRLRHLGQLGLEPSFGASFAVLNSVSQRDTQWRIVYAPREGEIRFSTNKNPRIKRLRISDFGSRKGVLYRDIHRRGGHLKPAMFGACTQKESLTLLSRVLNRLCELEEISRQQAKAILQALQKR